MRRCTCRDTSGGCQGRLLEADGLQWALAGASNNAITAAAVAASSAPLDVCDEMRPAACPEGCPVEPLRESVASMEGLLSPSIGAGVGGTVRQREASKGDGLHPRSGG